MFNSKKYGFELTQVQNVKVDSVKNAGDLISYIIGENQKLLDYGETGSLVVSKIEFSKKGEEVLFAQRLKLPMSPKTDFDELLEPFYTKKKLDFDEQILEEQHSTNASTNSQTEEHYDEDKKQEIEQVSPIQQKDDEEDYAPAPQIDLSDHVEDNVQASNEEQPSLSGAVSNALDNGAAESHSETNTPASTFLTEAVIKEMIAKEMKEKDQEIERLKQDLRVQERQDSLETANPTHNTEGTSSASVAPPDLAEDANVLDVIQMVKTEANKRLNDFIAQETAKINAEIEALDTRDKIEPSLTKQFEDEKANKAKALNKKVDFEKEEAIATEDVRHEAALQTIQGEFEVNRSKQLVALKEEFTNKLSVAIKEEYERQTEQLNLILQGKTEELQLRQKAVNEGMKNTVAEVLEGFNTNHGEVIQNVERRKNSNTVISLPKKVG